MKCILELWPKCEKRRLKFTIIDKLNYHHLELRVVVKNLKKFSSNHVEKHVVIDVYNDMEFGTVWPDRIIYLV